MLIKYPKKDRYIILSIVIIHTIDNYCAWNEVVVIFNII
jgi:hypothetical protein